MDTVVELPGMPRLGPLYRRALLRRGSSTGLPDVSLLVRDVAVDRAHLARYSRVCGFGPADTLPATYPHVLAFPLSMALMSRPDFPFPLIGLVHVRNRIDVLGRLDAGDRLTFTVHAEDLRPHERGHQVDVVAVAAADGVEIWRGRSTYLRRSSSGGPTPAPVERPSPADRPSPGQPDAVWRVEPSVGREYAAASGDRNPIHTSRLLARALGFKRTIAHGMWTKARCLAALEGRLPGAYTVDVSFKLPILLPAPVGFTARPDGDGWSFDVRDSRSGKPHLAGATTWEGGTPC